MCVCVFRAVTFVLASRADNRERDSSFLSEEDLSQSDTREIKTDWRQSDSWITSEEEECVWAKWDTAGRKRGNGSPHRSRPNTEKHLTRRHRYNTHRFERCSNGGSDSTFNCPQDKSLISGWNVFYSDSELIAHTACIRTTVQEQSECFKTKFRVKF